MVRDVIRQGRLHLLVWLGAWLLFWGAATSWAVSRFDPSFGGSGRVTVALGAQSRAHAVIVQPDGKIVVAGSTQQDGGLDFALLRFLPNGSLDADFNGDGTVITSLAAGDDEALALGLLSDGRIVAAGYSHNGADRDLALICYRQDGTLDRNFGDEGVTLTSIGNGNEELSALSINRSNRITAVGTTEGTAGKILVTVGYCADGQLDSSFGDGGVSLVGLGKDAAAEDILERPEGGFVLSGSFETSGRSSLVLVGLRPDGRLDPAFGTAGMAVPVSSAAISEGYGLTADHAGRLYVAGSIGEPGVRDAALFRFAPDGKVDLSFGDQGVAVTKVGEADDVLYDVTLGRGEVITSGFATAAGRRRFLVASCAVGSAQDERAGAIAIPLAEQIPFLSIWGNGATRGQIRQWRRGPSWHDDPLAWPLPAVPPLAGQRNFFMPAADLPAYGAAPFGARPLRPVTTSFSEGEAVSYAATADTSGNVVVVGTADGNRASTIAVARLASDFWQEDILDQPGYRSRHISTKAAGTITTHSVVTGGEIAAPFAKQVIRRGVVFSLHLGPVYHPGKAAINVSPGGPPGQSGGVPPSFVAEAAAAANAMGSGSFPAMRGKGHIVPTVGLDHGQTDNDSGTGAFSALIDHLRPGTLYFVRAYALTADGEVYYGNQVSLRTADACFIATAAFGTLLHPHVATLRDFRDRYLTQGAVGRRLMALYYAVSPAVADAVAQHGLLRFAARLFLLPAIGFAWLSLQAGMGAALLITGLLSAPLCWLVVRARRRTASGA